MRYRLQRKEKVARPNILGNCSQPVYTYRWKDIAACADRSELEKMMPDDKNYRIEDTRPDIGKSQTQERDERRKQNG